jgi:hypothetical protein
MINRLLADGLRDSRNGRDKPAVCIPQQREAAAQPRELPDVRSDDDFADAADKRPVPPDDSDRFRVDDVRRRFVRVQRHNSPQESNLRPKDYSSSPSPSTMERQPPAERSTKRMSHAEQTASRIAQNPASR